MPPKQSSSRKMPQTSVDANVKEDEESDVDDEGILKPKILAFEDSVLMDFQASHPDVLLKICGIFHAPASIKIVVEAFLDYPDPAEFESMLLKHITTDGDSLLTHSWGASRYRQLESLYEMSMTGTGLSPAESFHLNIDGVASCSVIPIQGDRPSSANVVGSGTGTCFVYLTHDTKAPQISSVGNDPLFKDQLHFKFLKNPYYRDLTNPLTQDEYAALNFLSQIFARPLSMGRSVLSKEYMTLAARVDIADASLVKTLRTVCLMPFGGWRRRRGWHFVLFLLLLLALLGWLGETALMGSPNLYGYPTPSSTAASARYKNLGLGTQALGIMLQVVRGQHGSAQLGTMESLYSLNYNGEGATPFVLKGQTLIRLP